MAQAERFWGAAWFHAPARWPTPDGYVPYRVFWAYWRTMESVRASEVLAMSTATLLPAQPEEHQHARLDTLHALAHPPEA